MGRRTKKYKGNEYNNMNNKATMIWILKKYRGNEYNNISYDEINIDKN